ncbi:MAG: hypothetical protein KGD60_03055 [Candidatus Thorarchaeota archaeon]|nr:hypothetical protein [Candidatus Thorarchaeota archaeon]
MMKHATLNKALLGMFLFLLVSSLVNVNATTTTEDETTEEDTTTEDETETTSTSGADDDSNDREVTIDATSTYVEIKSQLETGGVEDSFKIEVEVGPNGVEFKVGFETETATNETEREFEVQFRELIEYLDVNSNGVYDDSIDTDIQTLELDTFEPIVYTLENTAAGPVHIIDVLTTDGVFGARVYAVGDFTEVNGSVIAPTQVKIDVMIWDFNFTDVDSLLALKVELGSEMETSFDGETEDEEDGRAVDEAAIDVLMTDLNGFFSWKESAEIDGVTHAVNSSIHEVTSTEQEIYLNYPQGSEIIHDPKIGFENLLLVGSPLPIVQVLADNILPISVGLAIAVVGLIIVVKRRS